VSNSLVYIWLHIELREAHKLVLFRGQAVEDVGEQSRFTTRRHVELSRTRTNLTRIGPMLSTNNNAWDIGRLGEEGKH
jgi:hypothetical protein